MNHSHKTWILVAHGSGATIYESRGPRRPLACIMKFDNPLGRLRPGQLEGDRPGRAFDRHGPLVQRLVDRLERARAYGVFDRLALIAPPKLLGKLLRELSDPSRALLIASVAKDLSHGDSEQVRTQLDPLAFV